MAIAGLLIQACVSSPDAPPIIGDIDTVIAEREQLLRGLDDFSVRGGLGFSDDRQNVSASIVWTEAKGEAERDIRVAGPLGIGSLRLRETGGIALVERGGKPVSSGPDGGALLARTLGLDTPVPLGAISEWMRGLPGPNATDVKRDERGRLEQLRWTGDGRRRWIAKILRYKNVDGIDLPALVSATSAGGNLRLSLSKWDLALSTSADSEENPEPEPAGGGRLTIPGR